MLLQARDAVTEGNSRMSTPCSYLRICLARDQLDVRVTSLCQKARKCCICRGLLMLALQDERRGTHNARSAPERG